MTLQAGAVVNFCCNICGAANSQALDAFHRETPDCIRCGSSPRIRGMVHALSCALFGRGLTLAAWPERKDLAGVGFSDGEVYAVPLAFKTAFTNTFLHKEPRLDLLSDDWRRYVGADFIICAEVLEHVPAPYERALEALGRMISPEGVLIVTTPFTDRAETKEHFPSLSTFETAEIDGRWVVLNKTADGRHEVFDRDVHFHGGPGLVLEMRVFARADLLAALEAAGFTCMVYDTPQPEIGYVWSPAEQRPGDGVSLDHVIAARRA